MSAYRESVKEACERCGMPQGFDGSGPAGRKCPSLQVHHRDRDRSNNDPSNLETLCARCHTLEHNEQRRETKRNMVYLRLSPEMRGRWDAEAAKRGTGLSEMIRRMVEAAIAPPPWRETPMGRPYVTSEQVAETALARPFQPDFRPDPKGKR